MWWWGSDDLLILVGLSRIVRDKTPEHTENWENSKDDTFKSVFVILETEQTTRNPRTIGDFEVEGEEILLYGLAASEMLFSRTRCSKALKSMLFSTRQGIKCPSDAK